MAGIRIAALFFDAEAAHQARESMQATGVDHSQILVVDPAHPDAAAHTSSPGRLWGLLKHVFLPDDDAHPIAEGVSRGHSLLVADVSAAQQTAAVQAVAAAQPMDVEAHAEDWRNDGWSGTHAGQEEWIASLPPDRPAAGSEGITGSGFIAGDYGAVGGMIGGGANTNILRGKNFLQGESHAVRLDDGENVQVYEIH